MAAKKKSTAKKAKKSSAKGKKTTARKVTAKAGKKAGSATKANFDRVSKPRTKSQIMAALSDVTGVAKRDVGQIFDKLSDLIGMDLKNGVTFTVPGLMKVVVIRKPATKARKGVNPFTGEEMMFKAKPARNVVKVRPLKGLKDKV